MPLVQSIDYDAKRIYLGPDSVGVDVRIVDVYKEVRSLRRIDENNRNFFRLVTALGNEPAGPSNTPIFTNLSFGTRIVPYDSVHILKIVDAVISTDEGLAGPSLFDRSSLSTGVEVDIDYQPPQVEIVRVETGVSGLTPEESSALLNINSLISLVTEMHRIEGLDISAPLTVTQNSKVAGSIELEITGDGVTTATVTRI